MGIRPRAWYIGPVLGARDAFTTTLLVGLIGAAGCRLDPECFGQDDCNSGFVCSRGGCVLPDAAVSDSGTPEAGVDGGFVDVGFPDLGVLDVGFPDLGLPDAQRPDLGVPDAGLEDVGFLGAMMPAGMDPVAGTSTPTAVLGQFRDLQGVFWETSTGALLLSDVAGDTIYRMDPATPATSLRPVQSPSRGAVGIAADPLDGDLYVCESQGRLLREQPAAGGFDLPLVTNFHQYLFNSPNDVAVRTDGTLYFTDPPFGLSGRPRDIPFNGLYRFNTTTATITAEWMGLPSRHAPDGVALSIDETRLYLTEVVGRMIYVFDIADDGRLSNRRGFAVTQGITPNAIAVDTQDNVYVATSMGIEVYASTGYYWGSIPVPGTVSDLTFAPPNGQRIYATTTSTVYVVDVPIPGPIR